MTTPRAGAILLAVGAVTAMVCWWAAVPRPLTQDEVDPFAVQAAAISRSGPSVLGERSEESRFPGGTRYEIPHPTLFVLYLAAAFRLFGPGAATARAAGLACHLAGLALLWWFAQRAADPGGATEAGAANPARALARLAVGLCLLLPLAIQYPLFTDIDNSILAPLLLLQAAAILLAAESPTPRRLLLLAAASALALWAKETTPVLMLAAGGIWWMLRRGFLETLARFVPSALAGVALFGLTWWVFAAANGVPPDAFYRFTIQQKLLQDGTGPALGPGLRLLWNETQWIASWLSAPFLALSAWALLDRLLHLARTRRAGTLDLLLLFVLLLAGVHGLYYPGLKYIFPAVGPLCLLIADALVRRMPAIATREVVLAGALCGAIAAAMFFCFPDPVLPGWSMRRELFWTGAIPFAAGFALLLAAARARPARAAILSLLCATIGFSLSQDVRQRSMEAAVPSFGDYGERGAAGLIAGLDSSLPDECRVIVRNDIAFALTDAAGRPGRQSVEVGLFRNEPQVPKERLIGILADPAVLAVAFDSQEKRSWPAFTREEAIALARGAGLRREETYGDFLVLQR